MKTFRTLFAAFALAIFATLGLATPLTPAQRPTLLAAVKADPTAAAARVAGDTFALRAWLNAESAFIIWRTSVTQDEIMQNGFDWTRVDNLSVGKARVWEWLFSNQNRAFNPSKANVRAGIDQTWVGTAADLAVRAAVYVHCKRPATQVQKVFAAGTGTDLSPGTLVFEGVVDEVDVNWLVNQP